MTEKKMSIPDRLDRLERALALALVALAEEASPDTQRALAKIREELQA